MSDLKYEINPYEIRHMLSAPGLKPIDRFVYRELLDMCWMTEQQDRLEYKPEELCVHLGMDIGEFEDSVSRLSRPELYILSIFLDLDSASDEMCLSVKYLTDQLNEKTRDIDRERKLSFSDEAEKNNTVSIIDRISKRDSDFEPTILYIERKERALAKTYSGWLPTRNYGVDGEAYNIRDHLVASLKREFPGINVEKTFFSVFTWLMQNPDKRPAMSRVNAFIHQWFSNSHKAVSSFDDTEIDSDTLNLFSSL